MEKKDLMINRNDLDDIFGGAIKVKEKKEQAVKDEKGKSADEKTAAEAKPVSALVKKNKLEEMGFDEAPAVKKEGQDVDDLIKRAREIEKEMKTEVQNTTLSFADFLDEKTAGEILEVFDEVRKIMYLELIAYIDKKAVNNMLLRTLEKTAVSFVLLKNANWDTDGKLREDGSVDAERVVKNMEVYNGEIDEVDREIEEALKTVFCMRLKSIKLGMGKEKYESIKDVLIKKIRVVEAGYKKNIVDFVKKKIITPAFEKEDGEK